MIQDKINVAELLKDCPKGMELDCTMYEDVYFDYVDIFNIIHCYIQHETHKTSITFNQYGTPNSDIKSKCVIFPKGKTTWEGFHRPYINGDIVYTIGDSIAILGDRIGEHSASFNSYCGLFNYEFDTDVVVSPERFATEEEKAELFDVIKANGYKWNAETKTLEKLVEPKFKVGDTIKHKTHISKEVVVTEIKDTHYILNDESALPFTFHDKYELVSNQLVKPQFKVGDTITNGKTSITIGYIDDEYYYEISRNIANRLFIKNQDEWNLISNKFPIKFNINTLVLFESRVLMRSSNAGEWVATFYSHYSNNKFYGCGMCCDQCIPYEGNEHLIGKTDDCDKYFKSWE